jgi:hypothetical protein
MSLETASSVGLQLDKDGRKSLVSIAQHAPIPVDTCLNAPEDLQDTLVHTTSYADGNFLILSFVIPIMEIFRGGPRIFPPFDAMHNRLVPEAWTSRSSARR